MSDWAIQKTEVRPMGDEVVPIVWRPPQVGNRIPDPVNLEESAVWTIDKTAFARGQMVRAIDSAQSIVCVASFLFSDPQLKDAMLRATKRGVRCYLLTMSEQHLLKDPEQDSEGGRRQIED